MVFTFEYPSTTVCPSVINRISTLHREQLANSPLLLTTTPNSTPPATHGAYLRHEPHVENAQAPVRSAQEVSPVARAIGNRTKSGAGTRGHHVGRESAISPPR